MKYILFFGSLYAEKGILVIAEILEKFWRENEEYYFVFGNVWAIVGKNSAYILKKKQEQWLTGLLYGVPFLIS